MKNTKKTLWILLLLSAACRMEAQTPDEGFLYTDFEPDLEIDEGTNYTDTIEMDFNRDGSPDFIAYYRSYSFGARYFYLEPTKSDWERSLVDDTDSLTDPHIRWSSLTCILNSQGSDHWGIRCRVGDDFYYGWMRLYCINELGSTGRYCIVLDKMLFCTIPNYPLVWGQTTAIGDHIDTPFSIYPNPTDGVVRVKGKGFATVELFSMAGQRMAVKAMPDEDGLSIDIGGLPAGVYFVSITDTEGRKSVHKVVRE